MHFPLGRDGSRGQLALNHEYEYLYKFVSRDRVRTGGAAANRDLLDRGTLYAARFGEGRGEWLELSPGTKGLDAASCVDTPGDISIRARQAADQVGATKMDRPEWIAVHPRTREVYVTLTNNSQRGEPGRPATDAANPRARNLAGHIIRWREAGEDAAAMQFSFFALAGDPAVPGSGARYPHRTPMPSARRTACTSTAAAFCGSRPTCQAN